MENRSFNTAKGLRGIVLVAATLTIILLSVAGCKKSGELPHGVLTKDQMVKVLSEIYITEEKVNRLSLQADSSQALFDIMKGKVFDKTGTPDSVFNRSFEYYMDNPKDLELIYTALIDSLQLREQRAPVTRAQ
jgi:hypothetical protein